MEEDDWGNFLLFTWLLLFLFEFFMIDEHVVTIDLVNLSTIFEVANIFWEVRRIGGGVTIEIVDCCEVEDVDDVTNKGEENGKENVREDFHFFFFKALFRIKLFFPRFSLSPPLNNEQRFEIIKRALYYLFSF